VPGSTKTKGCALDWLPQKNQQCLEVLCSTATPSITSLKLKLVSKLILKPSSKTSNPNSTNSNSPIQLAQIQQHQQAQIQEQVPTRSATSKAANIPDPSPPKAFSKNKILEDDMAKKEENGFSLRKSPSVEVRTTLELKGSRESGLSQGIAAVGESYYRGQNDLLSEFKRGVSNYLIEKQDLKWAKQNITKLLKVTHKAKREVLSFLLPQAATAAAEENSSSCSSSLKFEQFERGQIKCRG